MKTDNMKNPAIVRVIGVGNGVEEIIGKVNSLGFDGVATEIATKSFECSSTNEEKMAIIVSIDDMTKANSIAKKLREAGVLTIGMVRDSDPKCYDSVLAPNSLCEPSDYSQIINTILQPVFSQSYISYDFNDLYNMFRDSGYFRVTEASGKDLKEATDGIRKDFNEIDFRSVESLSMHIYHNSQRSTPILMSEIDNIRELIKLVPESVAVVWSLNSDDTLWDNDIRISAVMAGKRI